VFGEGEKKPERPKKKKTKTNGTAINGTATPTLNGGMQLLYYYRE
jgi:hypothetical protein